MGRDPQENTRVAVVGGSAAGLFAAHLLASRGFQVQVLESAERLDPAPRTLIVTSRLRDVLGSLGEPAVMNQIRRFELFTDGRVATIPLQNPDLVIERSALIRALAQRAEHSGAEILSGKRLRSLQAAGPGIMLAVESGKKGTLNEAEAHIVIGADGAFSQVAKGAGWPVLPTVPLIQAVVRLPKDLPQDTSRVWFIPEETPYFYWLIPDSPTRGVLGLIGKESSSALRHLESFLERRGLDPIEFQSARIPAYTRWTPIHRRMGNGHVYLVGDAAGQVKVTTVGGIVAGFRGALGVTECICGGGASGHLRALRWELNLHLLIRRLLHQFDQSDYSSVVDLLNTSARRALSLYTRDEAAKLLWHAIHSQPRFLFLAMRTLFAYRHLGLARGFP
jgi:flavin-dependent dehydrogenase